MSNLVLGISAFGHDSSAALVDMRTGAVMMAIAEERLSNKKHDSRFPIGAIRKCQDFASSHGSMISHVAINFEESRFITRNVLNEASRLLADEASARALASRLLSLHKMGYYYSEQAEGFEIINREIDNACTDRKVAASLRALMPWYFNWAHKFRNTRHMITDLFPSAVIEAVPHHLSHAASAYISSGFDEATVVTFDGQGESETAGIFSAGIGGIRSVAESDWPNSLGIFYLMATKYLGFGPGDEYKVMGMSAYGKPRYDYLFEDCIYVDESGKVRFIENEYFKRKTATYGHYYFDFTTRMAEIIKPRKVGSAISQEHFDFAASVQRVLENCAVQIVRCGLNATGRTKVALAGGVALNGLMNERIRKESGCNAIFVFPASGDDGGSVGAAQYLLMNQPGINRGKELRSVYWGPLVEDHEIKLELERLGIIYEQPESINGQIALALASGNIVARFHSKSEFGPRALGHRSILADPRRTEMKEILNLRIKHREAFRPFAPACLYENVADYFDLDVESPFMLLIVQSKERAKREIPAVIHEDGTARVQTVTADANPDFYRTISEFKRLTGVPVVINTSFNVNGETIVETPLDAIESFGHMDIDYLAIGPYWVSKVENKHVFPVDSDERYLEKRKVRYLASEVWPYNQYNLDGILAPIQTGSHSVKIAIKQIFKIILNKLRGRA